MKLSIIIPAHNEEKRIEKTLESYTKYFNKKYKKDYEIIVVLNDCEDKTLNVVKKYKEVRILNFEEAIGKGGAIIEGFKVTKGDFVGFVDADNSTSVEEFEKLFVNIDKYEGIIASRYIKGAVVEPKQPISRRIASRGFNLLIRLLFNIKVKDSQCGAKIFTKETIEKITPKLGITRWAFDIDLLYQMKRQKLRFKEFPTVWRDTTGSTLNVKKATKEMFLAVIRLRLIYSPFKGVVRIYDKIF